MSSVLFVAPLLAAHLFAPGHVREVRASGIVVRAAATDGRGGASAQLELHAAGITRRIDLPNRAIGAERLLQSIEIVDANFDGLPDVLVMRESGAKWASFDVFLFDPHARTFTSTTPVARALARLSNPTFDAARKTITTRDIGPSNPSRVTYTLAGDGLRELAACRFLNPIDARTGTLVRTRAGATTYTHVRLGVADVDPCGP